MTDYDYLQQLAMHLEYVRDVAMDEIQSDEIKRRIRVTLNACIAHIETNCEEVC